MATLDIPVLSLPAPPPPITGLCAMKLYQGTHVIITGSPGGTDVYERLAVPDVFRLDIWLEWGDVRMRSFTQRQQMQSRWDPFPAYKAEVMEPLSPRWDPDAEVPTTSPVCSVKSMGLTLEGLVRRLQTIALTGLFSTADVSVFSDSSSNASTVGFHISDGRLQLASQGATLASMEETHSYYRRRATGYEEEVALSIMSQRYV